MLFRKPQEPQPVAACKVTKHLPNIKTFGRTFSFIYDNLTYITSIVLTQYEYNLRLTVTTLKGEYVNSRSIYTTYPDDILFNKIVRKVVVTESKLLVADFLGSSTLYLTFLCIILLQTLYPTKIAARTRMLDANTNSF